MMKGLVLFIIAVAARPAGVIVAYAGNAAPAGYVLCDGAAYEQSAWSALFAAIGTTYGGNDTVFNVPDLRGRVPVGLQTAPGSVFATALGRVVGEETHTLAVQELPSHTHGGTTAWNTMSHTHPMQISDNDAGQLPGDNTLFESGIGFARKPRAPFDQAKTFGADTSHSHVFTTDATGSGAAHSIVQPSIVIHWIIKV